MEYKYTFWFEADEKQRKIYQSIHGDVHITSKKFKYELIRYTQNGNVSCCNDNMTPAEFTICVKKIHQDYLKNLDILHARFQDVRHKIPNHNHVDQKAFTHTCYIHLPFEILYQRGNLKDIKITYQAC